MCVFSPSPLPLFIGVVELGWLITFALSVIVALSEYGGNLALSA